MLRLERTKKTDPRLLVQMADHYSKPKGFVGRNLCYAIYWDDVYYGHIVAGSAVITLPGRHAYLETDERYLNNIVANTFYHIKPVEGRYPKRNFTSKVLGVWRKRVTTDWEAVYGDEVYGFETLVEKPRTGDLYIKDGWLIVGQTVGMTCKRVANPDKNSLEASGFTGMRVWDRINLRPKIVLARRVEDLEYRTPNVKPFCWYGWD
jgi:hypothetical protein